MCSSFPGTTVRCVLIKLKWSLLIITASHALEECAEKKSLLILIFGSSFQFVYSLYFMIGFSADGIYISCFENAIVLWSVQFQKICICRGFSRTNCFFFSWHLADVTNAINYKKDVRLLSPQKHLEEPIAVIRGGILANDETEHMCKPKKK